MSAPESTCWTLSRGAVPGRGADRHTFARRYAPLVRAYLAARCRRSPPAPDLAGAVQYVLRTCCQAGGALDRAGPGRAGFRPSLRGAVPNIALRHETGPAPRREHQPASEFDIAARAQAFA